MDALIHLAIWIAILACVFSLLWYVLNLIPLPAPFDLVLKVVFAVIACLILISVLMRLGGLTLGGL
jgi:hypothetical protein